MHDVIPYLRYVHGIFNGIVVLLFLYQGWLGLTIRRDRASGRSPAAPVVKRHRKTGTLVALMGIAGFLGGAIIVYIDEGRIVTHPVHFIIGVSIAVLIITTYLISKKIKAQDPRFRTMHFIAGIVIVFLYFIQAFIGVRILWNASH